MLQKRNTQPKTPIEIFHLQYFFAKKVSEILQIDVENAMIEWTQLWYNVGSQNNENKREDKLWKEFVTNFDIQNQNKFVKRAYELYSKRDLYPYVFGFGCFDYFVINISESEKFIKISFLNNDHEDSLSPLDKSKLHKRKEELRKMFLHIKQNQPNITEVRGESWIYSLHSYRELFPKKFINSLEISEPNYRYSIWSQFQDFKGNPKIKVIEHFKNRIDLTKNIEEIHDAWHFKTHKTKCDIKYFYKHFGIK